MSSVSTVKIYILCFFSLYLFPGFLKKLENDDAIALLIPERLVSAGVSYSTLNVARSAVS